MSTRNETPDLTMLATAAYEAILKSLEDAQNGQSADWLHNQAGGRPDARPKHRELPKQRVITL